MMAFLCLFIVILIIINFRARISNYLREDVYRVQKRMVLAGQKWEIEYRVIGEENKIVEKMVQSVVRETSRAEKRRESEFDFGRFFSAEDGRIHEQEVLLAF